MNMTEEKAVKNLEGKEMIMKGEKKEEVAILENLGTEKGKPSMYGFVTQLITFKFIAAWIFCAFIQSLKRLSLGQCHFKRESVATFW